MIEQTSSWLVQLTNSQLVEPAWSCKRGIKVDINRNVPHITDDERITGSSNCSSRNHFHNIKYFYSLSFPIVTNEQQQHGHKSTQVPVYHRRPSQNVRPQ